MIQAIADGKKTLPDGVQVRVPFELQLGWLLDRHGIGVLGPAPDFKLVCRATRAADIYRAFKVEIKDRTPADWEIIKSVLRVVEGWKDG